MVLNLFLFTIKFERNHSSVEERINRYHVDQLIKARNEADQFHAMQASELVRL